MADLTDAEIDAILREKKRVQERERYQRRMRENPAFRARRLEYWRRRDRQRTASGARRRAA